MTYPYILITTKNSELLDNLGDDGLSHFFDVKEAFEVINRENIEIKALLYDATLVQQWGKDGRTFLNIADYLEEHNIVGKFPLWIITKNKINDADFNEFLLYNLITERWEHDREQPVDYINGSFQKYKNSWRNS